MLPTTYRLFSKILQQLAGQATRTRRSPQSGHVPGRHWVVFILRRMVEQATELQIPITVTHCDVAAGVDHLSHHVIIDALKVPPVFVAAWIREYRGSETFVKLDDITTSGIRRTRSVPQRDPCAADLFGAALDIPATAFCETCQTEKWELPLGEGYMVLLLFADNCRIIGRTQMRGSCLDSPARNTRQDAEKNDTCTKTAHRNC